MDTPSWPAVNGPRILTLIGNDITVDVRSRKTAASLARSGFSVIALGIASPKNSAGIDNHHGALLCRVAVTRRFRLIPFIYRFSRESIRIPITEIVSSIKARLRTHRNSFQFNGTNKAELIIRKYRHKTVTLLLMIILRIFRGLLLLIDHRFTSRPLSKSWRWVLPEMHHYESSIGPIVDLLEPDLIHVHDIFHLGLAVRAIERADREGRRIKLVYDIHEYIPGLPIRLAQRYGYEHLEKEYGHRADAFVTVSPGLKSLTEKRFDVPTAIVLNAPDLTSATITKPIREILNLSSEEILMVYVGGIAPHRGAELLIDAIPNLETNVHLVFVSSSTSGYVASLMERSRNAGVSNRVHFAPFVEPEAVVSYISSADLSLIPLSREIENYEVALPNKLFQSIHAGIPVVVSNNPDMEHFVNESGVGEVFTGGDYLSMIEAIKLVVEKYQSYHEATRDERLLSETSWEYQAGLLLDTYKNLGISTDDS
tara:strand:- start:14669 stop:16117 length:1449 start_codon:yes stop_codon:yes gene_type:complete